MNFIQTIFGAGKDLNVLQMCCRGAVVFIIAWLLIRIAGRRAFGLRRVLDNIIVILLGAVLSRAITGASPFVPTVCCCLVIVLLHRMFAMVSIRSNAFSSLMEGHKLAVYQNGFFLHDNMKKCLVSEEDIREQVRLRALTESLDEVEAVYMEKNGELSAIKKANR